MASRDMGRAGYGSGALFFMALPSARLSVGDPATLADMLIKAKNFDALAAERLAERTAECICACRSAAGLISDPIRSSSYHH
jgi:hypothetical protein